MGLRDLFSIFKKQKLLVGGLVNLKDFTTHDLFLINYYLIIF